jgi:hypothetical protein
MCRGRKNYQEEFLRGCGNAGLNMMSGMSGVEAMYAARYAGLRVVWNCAPTACAGGLRVSSPTARAWRES